MPLLNYTTEVAATRSASQVQELLAKAGARQIVLDFDASARPTGVGFVVETQFGPRTFVLPINAVRVLQAMKASKVPPRYQTTEQAERVAWRILKDWIEAQLALISTEMVSLDQVMLPYMATPEGGTVWDRYLDTGQLALAAGAS